MSPLLCLLVLSKALIDPQLRGVRYYAPDVESQYDAGNRHIPGINVLRPIAAGAGSFA